MTFDEFIELHELDQTESLLCLIQLCLLRLNKEIAMKDNPVPKLNEKIMCVTTTELKSNTETIRAEHESRKELTELKCENAALRAEVRLLKPFHKMALNVAQELELTKPVIEEVLKLNGKGWRIEGILERLKPLVREYEIAMAYREDVNETDSPKTS